MMAAEVDSKGGIRTGRSEDKPQRSRRVAKVPVARWRCPGQGAPATRKSHLLRQVLHSSKLIFEGIFEIARQRAVGNAKVRTNLMKKYYILFDFDGVIADSFQPAFEIQKTICPQLTKDLYRQRFERNINDWEEPINGHTKECRHDIDFFTEYIPRMKNEVQIVPGMKEVLIKLEEHHTLIIVSSTITSPIQEFLERHGVINHFAQVMGNDIHTSKVEKIKMVFEQYHVAAKDCVFITDTLGDMREAKKMRVGSIGVTWGFQTAETLLRGKPFRLVEKPDKLLTAVNDYFRAIP